MPEIKICGIKNNDTINAINQLPISYIGFVFAESKRKISLEKACEFKNSTSKKIKVVGVFVNSSLQEIKSVLTYVSLDVIQLHGNEDMGYINELKKFFHGEVWKALPVKGPESILEINKYSEEIPVLLDTFSDKERGGTGKTFDWEIARGLSEKRKIILAGGLDPDNVLKAMEIVKPQVVDTSSGVETNGCKDIEKIKCFVGRVEKYGK